MNSPDPVVQMPLETLKSWIAEHIRQQCSDLEAKELPGLDRAASKVADAVYQLCRDESGDTPDLTQEDAMFWTGILSEAILATADQLYTAHFGDNA